VWLVIADTSPINYLILIRHVDLLPRLFEFETACWRDCTVLRGDGFKTPEKPR
jgi:hypothetical protein